MSRATSGKLIAALAALAAAAVAGPAAAQTSATNGEAGGMALVQKASVSRAKGERTAPVVVYEIADFQCPFCGRFANEVFPRIDSAYVRTGKVQWVFVNLPLPMHPNAWAAAKAALCAGGVADRFWAMHERLYATQKDWSDAQDAARIFAADAHELGVPDEAYHACYAGDRVAPVILKDVIFAAGSRISGTPSFVVNDTLAVVGVKDYDEWKTLLDRAIAAKTAAAKRP